jgi:DNA mismatch endonuclease Vsr
VTRTRSADHTPEPVAQPAFADVPEGRRRNMRAVRGRDTAAELTVRRLLHRLGYRFALHGRGLPGRPDIVFSARRKAIEVRGCFGHRHPDPGCRNAVLPATRREWWAEKLEGNVTRDARNLEALTRMGWQVLVVWECEVRDAGLVARLGAFLGPARFRPGG